MNLSNIANVIDIEHDNGRLIEIGLTTINLQEKKILQTYSLPIKPDFDLSPEITELTGWTTAKLNKQGLEVAEAARRMLESYGSANRLLISDSSDEIPFLEKSLLTTLSPHRLNIAILFSLVTGKETNLGLESMLAEFKLEFEGELHSAGDDSQNIARLFLEMLRQIKVLDKCA